MATKHITIWKNADARFLIPVKRDGVDAALGESALVEFTIDGLITLSTAGETPRVSILDPLDNEAIVHLPKSESAELPAGTYRAQCVVRIESEDEQVVWEGDITIAERLPNVA